MSTTLRIRFALNASAGAEDARIDHFILTGTPPPSGSFTANARVELIDPSANATVLEDYGAASASPYDVLGAYTGAGTYRIRLTENGSGGTASVTAGSVNVVRNAGTGCDVSTCGSVPNPKEASPVGFPLGAAKEAGTAVSLSFTPGCGATDHSVYLGTGPIVSSASWTGSACSLVVAGSAQFDPGSPSDRVHFVVVA